MNRALKCLTLGVSILSASSLPSVAAEDGFFANKTITVLIASSAGGGLDTFGRVVSRHLGKHLPGTPNVIAQNMPGAGGALVAGQLYNVVPKDGTVMGIPFASVIMDPLLTGGRKEYDPKLFNYIGNAQSEVLLCFVRKDSPWTTLADTQTKEIILGSSAPGSPSYDFPIVAQKLLGLKLKMVTGYKGSREVTLAMEAGELQGTCGLSWTTLKIQYPDVIKGDGFGRVFAQEDITGLPKFTDAGVPKIITLAKTDEQKQAFEMLYSQNSFARPFLYPPGVPAERVQIVRRAFDETMKDPELVSEAGRLNIDLAPSTGEAVQAAVEKLYRTPQKVIDDVKAALATR